jgi:hypothetical protein
MKNKFLSIFLATVILLSVVTSAQAAKSSSSEVNNSNAAGNTASQESASQGVDIDTQTTTVTSSQPAVQVQNQVKTQNQGENSQLKVETKEETNTALGSGSAKNESSRSAMAEEKMSEVAAQVELLLTNKTIKGGIGEQVREIATAQKQAQEEIKNQLDQVKNRKGFVKFLMGSDYKALKDVEKQIEANQLRIEKLTELKTQLTNQNDLAMVEAAIQVLTEQNTQLQDTVTAENQTKSMFGWLFKYFAQE